MSQDAGPVKWSFDIAQDSEYYIVSAKAKIKDPWVVYSCYTDEGGPIPSALEFTNESGIKKIGEVEEEGLLILEKSELFGIDVAKFEKEVTLVQKVKLDQGIENIKGYVRFMTCDGARCLAPTNIDFSFAID